MPTPTYESIRPSLPYVVHPAFENEFAGLSVEEREAKFMHLFTKTSEEVAQWFASLGIVHDTPVDYSVSEEAETAAYNLFADTPAFVRNGRVLEPVTWIVAKSALNSLFNRSLMRGEVPDSIVSVLGLLGRWAKAGEIKNIEQLHRIKDSLLFNNQFKSAAPIHRLINTALMVYKEDLLAYSATSRFFSPFDVRILVRAPLESVKEVMADYLAEYNYVLSQEYAYEPAGLLNTTDIERVAITFNDNGEVTYPTHEGLKRLLATQTTQRAQSIEEFQDTILAFYRQRKLNLIIS